MSGETSPEQQKALEAYHQARTAYHKNLKAAKRVVGVGEDADLDSRIVATHFEKRRKASVDALVHESALALSEAYSRARTLGCFEKGN